MACHRLPSIVEYYGAFHDEAHLYIVMEYCGGGDLLEKLLRDKKALPGHPAPAARHAHHPQVRRSGTGGRGGAGMRHAAVQKTGRAKMVASSGQNVASRLLPDRCTLSWQAGRPEQFQGGAGSLMWIVAANWVQGHQAGEHLH